MGDMDIECASVLACSLGLGGRPRWSWVSGRPRWSWVTQIPIPAEVRFSIKDPVDEGVGLRWQFHTCIGDAVGDVRVPF